MTENRRLGQILTSTLFFVSFAYFLFFLVIVFLRLRYPYEIEWLEGAFMDHIMRVREGHPIYVAPSIDYVPYLYTPLYYYVAAALMSVFGEGLFAARLVSLLSTLLCAALIYRTVYRCGIKSRVFAVSGAAIFIAAFGFGGFYYDAVRMDMLMVLFLLLATVSAIELKGIYRSMFTALLLLAAYFTKQQALFAVPALCLWLFLSHRRDAVQVLVLFGAMLLLLALYFQRTTEGWFYYYTFEITRQIGKDFHLQYALTVLPFYTFRYWFLLYAAAIFFFWKQRTLWYESLASPIGLVFILTLAMLVSGIVSMGNLMGYVNLNIPFAAFASMLLPLALSALVDRKRISYSVALIVILLQIGVLSYSLVGDKLVIPTEADRAGGEEFVAALRAIPGEVYVQDHGYLPRLAGKKSHAHITPILNLLEMNDSVSHKVQMELDSAYRHRRFAAVVLDADGNAQPDSLDGYIFARKIFTAPNIFNSRKGSGATRPDFIYIPTPKGEVH